MTISIHARHKLNKPSRRREGCFLFGLMDLRVYTGAAYQVSGHLSLIYDCQ